MGWLGFHDGVGLGTTVDTLNHRPLFQANPVHSGPCSAVLAPKTGKRGRTKDVISEVPIQTKAKAVIRSKSFTENEHRTIPKSCPHNDLVTGSKDHIWLRTVSDTGQIEANDGFTILPDNTAKVNLVRLSQGAKTAGRCDGSRQGEVRLVDGNGIRAGSSNFTVDVE